MHNVFKILSKTTQAGIIIFILVLGVFNIAKAAPPDSPYNPGDVLDPGCAPTSANCTVHLATTTWINAGSYIYPSSTSWNVGIGTTTPATTLYVNGSTTISNGLTLTNLAGTSGCLSVSSNGLITTSTCSGASGIASLNGSTSSTQTFSGIDIGISTLNGVHTFTNLGVVSLGAATGTIILQSPLTMTSGVLGMSTSTATQNGFLKAADWLSFNSKITTTSLSVAYAPLSYNSDTGVFSLPTSTASQSGFLSSGDWTTFSGKQNAITFPLDYASTTGVQNTLSFPLPVASTSLSASQGLNLTGNALTNIGVLSLTGGGGITVDKATGTITLGSTGLQSTITFPIPVASTSLTATTPLSISGNNLSLPTSTATQNGFLKAADWLSFNSKITTTSLSVAYAPLSYNSDTGVFSLPTSTASQSGFLSSGDWTTFSGKQNAITFPLDYASTTGVQNTLSFPLPVASTSLSASQGLNLTGNALTNIGVLSLTGGGGITVDKATGTITLGSTGLQSTITFPIPVASTSLTATTPLSISGNNLSLPTSTATQNGFLKAADWLSFNSKITTTSLSVAYAPLSYNSDTGVFSLPTSTASQSGFLSSGDWTTFSGKQNAITFPLDYASTTGVQNTLSFPLPVASTSLSASQGLNLTGNALTNIGVLSLTGGGGITVDKATGTITLGSTGLQSTITFPIPVASTSLSAGNMLVLTGNSLAATTTPTFTTINGYTPSSWITSPVPYASTTGVQNTLSFPLPFASTTGGQAALTFPLPYSSTTPPTILGSTYIGVSTINGTSTLTNLGVQTLTGGGGITVTSATGTITLGSTGLQSSITLATSGASGLSITSSSGSWTFAIATSSSGINGFLSGADWDIFNNKQNVITFPISFASTTGVQAAITFPIPVASTSLSAGNMLVLTGNSLAATTTPTFTTINGYTPSSWITSPVPYASTTGVQNTLSFPLPVASTSLSASQGLNLTGNALTNIGVLSLTGGGGITVDKATGTITLGSTGLQSTITFPIPVASTSLSAGNMLVLTGNSLAATTTPTFTTINGYTPSSWITSPVPYASTTGVQNTLSFPLPFASTTGGQAALTFPLPYSSTTPPTILGSTYIGVSTINGTSTLTNLGVQTLTGGGGITVTSATGTITLGSTGLQSSITLATSGASGLSITSSSGSWTFAIATSSSGINGFLSGADWDIFNNKQNVITFPISFASTTGVQAAITFPIPVASTSLSAGNMLVLTGNSLAATTTPTFTTINGYTPSSWITSPVPYASTTGVQNTLSFPLPVASTSLSATTPLSITGNVLSMPTSTVSVNGYLSATDWLTFNSKITTTSLSASLPIVYNNTTGAFTFTNPGFITATSTAFQNVLSFPLNYSSTTHLTASLPLVISAGNLTFTNPGFITATSTAFQNVLTFPLAAASTTDNTSFPIGLASTTGIQGTLTFPIAFASTSNTQYLLTFPLAAASTTPTLVLTSSTITNATTTYLNFTNATGTGYLVINGSAATNYVSSSNAYFNVATTTKLCLGGTCNTSWPGGTVAGSDKYLQYNNGGSAFGGDINLQWSSSTQLLTITGSSTFSGNVGIGTTTPATLFTVATTSNIFNVLSNGNVGIGTTSPTAKLEIADNNTSNLKGLRISNTAASVPTYFDIAGGYPANYDQAITLSVNDIVYIDFNAAIQSMFFHKTVYASDNVGMVASSNSGNGFIPWNTGDGNSFTIGSVNEIHFNTGTLGLDQRLTIENTGNVGIGTTAPTGLLHLASGSNTILFATTTGSTNYGGVGIGTTTPSLFTVASSTGGNSLLTVLPSGNIGIGTSTPSFPLDIYNNSLTGSALVNIYGTGTNNSGVIVTTNGTAQFKVRSSAYTDRELRFQMFSDGNTYFGTSLLAGAATSSSNLTIRTTNDAGAGVNTGQIRFSPSNVQTMVITSSTVGIGASAPLANLHILGANGSAPTNIITPQLTLESSATAGAGVGPVLLFRGQTGNSTAIYGLAAIQGVKSSTTAANYSGDLTFSTQNSGGATALTEQMRITSIGRVGIGTTNPYVGLTVGGSNPAVQVGDDSTNGWLVQLVDANNRLRVFEQNTGTTGERLTILSGGNVGIGTTTPATLFTVATTSNIFNVLSNGNVGIGTTSPVAQLHLYTTIASPGSGEATGIGQLRLDNNASALSSVGGIEFKVAGDTNGYGSKIQAISSGGSNLVFAGRQGTGTWTEYMRILAGGNVGIGTTTPPNLFTVQGSGLGIITMGQIPGITQYAGISFTAATLTTTNYNIASDGTHLLLNRSTGSGILFREAGADQMTIRTGGNVGIGTTTPATLFTVATTTNIFNVLSNGNVGIGTTGPLSKLDVNGGVAVGSYAGANAAPSNGMIISGDVGIGRTDANARLDVSAPAGRTAIYASSIGNYGGYFFSSTSIGAYGNSNGNGGFGVYGAAPYGNGVYGYSATSTAAGVYGINSNGYGVYCSGAFCGGTQAWTGSDIRLKDQIQTLPSEEGLAAIMQLRPVSFHWRDVNKDAILGRQIGFIAQEVGQVFPDVVKASIPSMDIQLDGSSTEKISNIQTIADSELVPPIIKSIQEIGTIINFSNASTTRTTLTIDASGNIGTTGDIVPTTDNLYSLGTSTLRWANVYAATSTVGDLVFGNNFRITETTSTDGKQTLTFKNQNGLDIMSLDENGNLVVPGSISSASSTGGGGSGIISNLVDQVKSVFASLGILIENGITKVQNLAASLIQTQKLEIGSSDIPSGFTIYDKITKQPYCVTMENGEIVKTQGSCDAAAQTQTATNSNTTNTTNTATTQQTSTTTTQTTADGLATSTDQSATSTSSTISTSTDSAVSSVVSSTSSTGIAADQTIVATSTDSTSITPTTDASSTPQ